MIDILTDNEELFVQQVSAIIDAASKKDISENELSRHYLNLGNVIEAIHIRSEKVYPEILKLPSPDYTQIMVRASLKLGKIRSKINFNVK